MSILAPDIDAYLDKRLQQWAEWYSHGNHYGVGYPPVSITFWACYQIAKIDRKSQSAPLPCNPDAEETQKLIEKMVKYGRHLVDALYCQYFTYGSLRDKAQKLGLSHSQFRMHLEMAKAWLAGRLSGMPARAKKEEESLL